jgi:hypothetical protein
MRVGAFEIRRRETQASAIRAGVLSCSFCHKSEDSVGKLISSPSDYPRAYICDECIAVGASILEDDRGPSEADAMVVTPGEETHPLLAHPLASSLFTAMERWIRCEALGGDAAQEFAEFRSIAARMVR